MLRHFTFSLTCLMMLCSFSMQASTRKTIPLNNHWKFILHDTSAASQVNYNDESWRTLNLPHDWSFENGYSKDGAQSANGGYTSGGIGWYRKVFTLSSSEYTNKQVFIDFEGVYMNSEVWVNGHYLGKRPYGYISFGYELTSYLKSGENLISVRVDNSLEPSARWYHGCGIYGHVSLSILPVDHFKKWGTVVVVDKSNEQECNLHISSQVTKQTSGSLRLRYRIKDNADKEVYRSNQIKLGNSQQVEKEIKIKNPTLWDIETPHLYTLTAQLLKNGHIVDEIHERFGVRSIAWKGDTGFWLNGRNVKLQGVCEHLEGGPVGAAWTENLLRWKIMELKGMGCNAIRTSHNPQLPMFYDICDEVGMLVLDEAFDGWKKKAKEDYGKQAFATWWERDLRDFVRRDRNHPSVIAYSLGNETKGDIAKDLVRVCHEEDSTRLVTSGHSSSDYMDILGVNGNSEKKRFIENYKATDKAFVGTETPHTWQVRSYYRSKTWYRDGYPNKGQDPFETPDLTPHEIFTYEWADPKTWVNGKQHFNSSYDNAFVRINVRQNIAFLRDLPWYSGSFRWTGFDYIGEASYVHGGWPFRAFMGGVIDLAGFKKDHYYLYQSQWTNTPMVHILPHWSHPDMKKGEKIPVWVYTTGDTVELFLNGHSLGKKHNGQEWNHMQCEWLVPWTPGNLEAVAYLKGKEIARTSQTTADAPSMLKMKVEDAYLTGQSEDLHIMTIAQVDKKGTLYPYGENRVYWALDGKGEVYSAENGNPVDIETNYHAESKKTFFGLLRLFIRQSEASQPRLYVGSILGDKRLKSDNHVSIDVQGIDLQGHAVTINSCSITYTTDGSDPGINGKKYTKPFELDKESTVRALVVINDTISLNMEERFGPKEGIYWGTNEKVAKLFDIQAENCHLQGSTVSNKRPDFQSSGYVVMEKNNTIGFYQENDGAKQQSILNFRYLPVKSGKISIELWNNDKKVGTKDITITPIQVGTWRQDKLLVELVSGANSILFVNKSDGKIAVDSFDFSAR